MIRNAELPRISAYRWEEDLEATAGASPTNTYADHRLLRLQVGSRISCSFASRNGRDPWARFPPFRESDGGAPSPPGIRQGRSDRDS